MGDSDPDSSGQPDSSGSPGPGGPAERSDSGGPAERPDPGGPPDPVRREAERLVAAALGAIRMATAGAGPAGPEPGTATRPGGASVTGAAECAFCPLCRAIAALRDPSPEFAGRLAVAAGDLATGLTGLLRVFSTVTSTRVPGGTPVAERGADGDTADEVWREATRTRHDSGPAPERDVPETAPGADAEVRPGDAVPPADAAGSARVPQPSVPPEPAGTEPGRARDAARRRVPAPHACRVPGAADDGPGRRD